MNRKTIRILHVVRKMDKGGVQSMIMNYYRNIDPTMIQFDFVVQDSEKGFYDDEIYGLGGNIYIAKNLTNIFGYYNSLNTILKQNKYQIIHIHQNFANVHSLLVAYFNKIPVRISHSHNDYPEKNLIRKIMKKNIKLFINILSTHRFSCSVNAGNWLYGVSQVKKGNVYVVNNAINTEKYSFNKKTRIEVRRELNLKDSIVIGHVGNFNTQKNHSFLIDVFEQYLKINKNSFLFLVGEGNLENTIRKKVESKNMNENVKFLGTQSDVEKWLNVFDIFLLPSLHEGLPVTLIEAQTTGLKCLISNEVTKDVALTNLLKYLSLDLSPDVWAKELNNMIDSSQLRTSMSEKIKFSGYDIKIQSKILSEKYFNMYDSIEKKEEKI